MKDTDQRSQMAAARPAITLWIVIVGFLSVYVLSCSVSGIGTVKAVTDSFWNGIGSIGSGVVRSFNGINFAIQILIIVGWVLIEVLLAWMSPRLVALHPFVLMGSQLAFTFTTTYALTNDMPALFVGVAPILMIECINYFSKPLASLIFLSALYMGLVIYYVFVSGWLQAFITAQAMVFLLFVVGFYWRFYNSQRVERQRAQDLLEEVKIAYSQVELSAQRAERQRVAREMHDTLVQGLAGTVLRLEASQSFLDQGKSERGREVLEEATLIARETLRESRVSLTQLRGDDERGLSTQLRMLVATFEKDYGLQVDLDLAVNMPVLEQSQQTNVVRIVSEALMNVVKHAGVAFASVHASVDNGFLALIVSDHGTGAPAKIKKGHYGLQGMSERASALGGTLEVVGEKGQGTSVILRIPTQTSAFAPEKKEER
ncbi:MAG: sensor histidine kinase [Bifidobacteriaceae bacterium]|jgi:NarL family two-component system sensor histidine kinase YdfH|nr:sensor histidine kinase [Bifidobacteriaceae bacterium]